MARRLLQGASRLKSPFSVSLTSPFSPTTSSIQARGLVPSSRLQPRRHYAVVSAGELQFGQPLHETHPHLLKSGESLTVTTGITALEYAARRADLASRLPAGSVAIVAAADVKYRSGAVFYDYSQSSDFFYLTGFLETEAVAVIQRTGTGTDHIFHLFVRPKDARAEQWDGARSGLQAALDVFNADETGDISQIDKLLSPILKGATDVYTDLPSSIAPRSKLTRSLLGHTPIQSSNSPSMGILSQFPKYILPLRSLMNSIRVTKSDAEITLMRRAGQASGRSITRTMGLSLRGERDVQIEIETGFLRNGLDRSAYVPVVAGGQNGLSIHYVSNNCLFRGDEMVLVDAGGEVGGYATDISRTWPVGGKFSPAQRDLYSVVLDAQRTCIKRCRVDSKISLDQLHREAEGLLQEGLRQLGFDVSGDAMRVLFPHHLGHFLGLEVHDCPGHRRDEALTKNQVVTVEPGIYVPNDSRWPQAFRGIGIRIEDSVCVKEDCSYVLTTEAVKEIVDIEALRS